MCFPPLDKCFSETNIVLEHRDYSSLGLDCALSSGTVGLFAVEISYSLLVINNNAKKENKSRRFFIRAFFRARCHVVGCGFRTHVLCVAQSGKKVASYLIIIIRTKSKLSFSQHTRGTPRGGLVTSISLLETLPCARDLDSISVNRGRPIFTVLRFARTRKISGGASMRIDPLSILHSGNNARFCDRRSIRRGNLSIRREEKSPSESEASRVERERERERNASFFVHRVVLHLKQIAYYSSDSSCRKYFALIDRAKLRLVRSRRRGVISEDTSQ